MANWAEITVDQLCVQPEIFEMSTFILFYFQNATAWKAWSVVFHTEETGKILLYF